MLLEHDTTKRIATVRLARAGAVLDLLFASSGIEAETVREAEMLELLPTVAAPIATIPHLMALKLLARHDQARPQDIADLLRLKAVATRADLTRFRELAELIVQRGYHRQRDLVAQAARFLA